MFRQLRQKVLEDWRMRPKGARKLILRIGQFIVQEVIRRSRKYSPPSTSLTSLVPLEYHERMVR